MNLLALILLAIAADEPKPLSFTVTVSAGKHDRVNELVRVSLIVPANPQQGSAYDAAGKLLGPVAVTRPSLGGEARKAPDGSQAVDAAFVLPRLEAGKTITIEVRLDGKAKADAKANLRWQGEAGTPLLTRGEGAKAEPVLGYQMPKLDVSTPQTREATFKPFHEAYVDGVKVTKGVGGLFTHHRGLYYGFMKVTYGKNTVDIWHCKAQTHQAHRQILDSAPANPVLGQHRVAIDWNGAGGKTFATEERELTAIPLPGGTLLEFVSKLTPTGDDVKLDGDPQHAGFHFRASNEVAEKTKNETYFIRPDGIGAKGKETNWPGNKKHVDLPWLGMSFVMGGERYTAGYIDHPGNPKEARFSERTYGRFGSYFVTTATKEKPLVVRYRLWLQKGEATPKALEALSNSFVAPVEVKVAAK